MKTLENDLAILVADNRLKKATDIYDANDLAHLLIILVRKDYHFSPILFDSLRAYIGYDISFEAWYNEDKAAIKAVQKACNDFAKEYFRSLQK